MGAVNNSNKTQHVVYTTIGKFEDVLKSPRDPEDLDLDFVSRDW